MTRPGIMTLSSLLAVVVIILMPACTRFSGNGFHSSWERYPDSRWAGPDLWANRLADWEVREGRLTCTAPLPLRTVHLVTRSIGPGEGNFVTIVRIRREGVMNPGQTSAAGILCGAGASSDYLRASLVFHSWGEGAGLFFGIDGAGKVFIRDLNHETHYVDYATHGFSDWKNAILKVTVTPSADPESSEISIIAVDPATRNVISELNDVVIPSGSLEGSMALVSHNMQGSREGTLFSFSRWAVRGSRITSHRERKIGPVVASKYTLDRKRLKLSAQLMPLEKELCDSVELQTMDEESWQTIAVAAVDTPSYSVTFSIDNWSGSSDRQYRLLARYRFGNTETNTLRGIIRHDPVDKESLVAAAISGSGHLTNTGPGVSSGIDAGYFPFEKGIIYPHTMLTRAVERHKPDLLIFTGDQVSEDSPTANEYGSDAYLDYLYKWYLWCISFRELTANIPAVVIPDDNDIYHDKLWGAGGVSAPDGLTGGAAQDAGGYLMPPRFINMVQKTQTNNLPDPADPHTVGKGTDVFFTDCNVGGISFGIIEDRKFKSAPAPLLPEAMITDGIARNRLWNPERQADIEGASLLGDRQEKFLTSWSEDWSDGTWMKVMLSPALLASMSTLPDGFARVQVTPFLPVPDSVMYISGDRIAADYNSNGWPQGRRNSVLKTVRKAFALHIAGGSPGITVQYGTDSWRDAGFAIVAPSTGNRYGDRWFPPVAGLNRREDAPKNTGDFKDGFGNKISVFAVDNTVAGREASVSDNQLSAAYSLVVFNRKSRQTEVSVWPVGNGPSETSPLPGWPVVISQTDNYGRSAAAWLPEIVTEGMTDPVIRVISQSTGELVYNLRISGNAFQPWVFNYGLFTVEAGDPDSDRWVRAENLAAWSTRERAKVVLSFQSQ